MVERRLLKTVIIWMISLLPAIALVGLVYISLPWFPEGEQIRPGSLRAFFTVERVLRDCPVVQAVGQPMFSNTEDAPHVQLRSLHYISKGSPTEILSTTEKHLLENGFEKVGDRVYSSGSGDITIVVEVEDETLAGQDAEHIEGPTIRVSVDLWNYIE